MRNKIKALYQLIFLNVFGKKKKKKSDELEKKLHSKKVDRNRSNGSSRFMQTVMDRTGPHRLQWTEMDQIDQSRQKLMQLDKNGPHLTKLDKRDQRGPKQTELDQFIILHYFS